jgi:hypothetical protein
MEHSNSRIFRDFAQGRKSSMRGIVSTVEDFKLKRPRLVDRRGRWNYLSLEITA